MVTGHCAVVSCDRPKRQDEGQCSFLECFLPFGQHVRPHHLIVDIMVMR